MKFTEHINGLQHVGIPAVDLDETAAFLVSMGFEITRREVQPNRQPVVFMRLKDLVLEVYQTSDSIESSGKINHLALDVKGIHDLYNGLTANGWTALEGNVCFLPFWDNGIVYFTIQGPGELRLEFCQKLTLQDIKEIQAD